MGLASSDYDKQQFIYCVLIPGYTISGFFGAKFHYLATSKQERKKESNPCRQVCTNAFNFGKEMLTVATQSSRGEVF